MDLSAGVFASIGSAFKFADVALRIAEVGSENAVFVRGICVVRSDLEEVERLLSMHSIRLKLTGLQGKLSWIMTAVRNTKCALNEIGKWVERARVEQETTGSIKFDTRVRWVFSDREKLLNRQMELSACHQQLSNVLGYLTSLEGSPLAPTSVECAEPLFLDETAGHEGPDRPQTSASRLHTLKSGLNGDVRRSDSAQLEHTHGAVPPLHRDTWISADMITSSIYERGSRVHDGTYTATSTTSPLSPPRSLPPSYATAVSTIPTLYNVPLGHRSRTISPLEPAVTDSSDNKELLPDTQSTIRAYIDDTSSMYIPELVGDTVDFHATNSTGPVNPYELYTNADSRVPKRVPTAQRSREDFAELLGDIHFYAEPANKKLGAPSVYPPQVRETLEHVEFNLATNNQARRRTTLDTLPRIRRRPVPTDTLSDSQLTVRDTSSPLVAHNRISPQLESSTHLAITGPHVVGPYTTLLTEQRPASYTASHSQPSAGAAVMNVPKHYSAPAPVDSSCSDRATAYSADSTSSWGLDTTPKGPKIRTEEPAKLTRMQSRMRIMDLLSRIDA